MDAILRPMDHRLRLTLPVAIMAVLLATLSAPAGAATPDDLSAGAATTTAAPSTSAARGPEAAPDTASGTGRYRFVGYGTDHGVGLNQRGAAGRARAGQLYPEILAHYFPRTTLGTIPTDTIIRALVVKDYKPTEPETLLVKGTIGGWTIDSPDVVGQIFPIHSVLVLIGTGQTGAWNLEVRKSATSTAPPLATFTDADADLTVTPVPPVEATDPVGDIEVLIRPTTRYDRYQGTTRIARRFGRIRVVNNAPIEAFVRSVTPQELGPSNLLETLKTQAVAARSYFLAGLTPTNAWSDVKSYRDSYSYLGVNGENPTVSVAVDATAYQVLKYKNTIVRAFYHAVGGGATEASANVFTGPAGKPGTKTPYLRGGPDVDEDRVPYDIGAAAYRFSTRTFTLKQLSAILAKDPRTNVGTLTSWPIESEARFRARRAADPLGIAPANRGVSGRLTWVVLRGTAATKRVAGWLFKSVFDTYRGSGDPIHSTMIFLEAVP